VTNSTHAEWKGRSILVTGGTSGIGKGFAERLAVSGAKVLVTGRNEAALTALQAEHPSIAIEVCDLSDPTGVRQLAAATELHFGANNAAGVQNDAEGGLDMLINNAGLMEQLDILAGATSTHAVTDERIVQETMTNLVAPILLTRCLLPLLRRGHNPVVVMVTSGYALLPATRAPTYSATKAGLRSFTMSLRRQLKSVGIRVVEIVPPLVDTPRTKSVPAKKMSVESLVDASLRGITLGKDEILPGQVAMLPVLMRIAPSFAANLVAKS
jgi:uncharacterized oxidoreductase